MPVKGTPRRAHGRSTDVTCNECGSITMGCLVNTEEDYGGMSIVVHWAMAALLIALVILGLYMVQLPDAGFDFTDSRNMMIGAITLLLRTGDFTLKFGEFALGGIGTATFGALILNALLKVGRRESVVRSN